MAGAQPAVDRNEEPDAEMSFLAPLFLLGGAAIIGPIVFHLIRRTTPERRVFSSLMFLQPSPPRLARRHRLEHLVLLLLRCAALALLGLAFARPYFSSPRVVEPLNSQPRRTLILVDTSASMRREGVWAAAKDAVQRRLREAAPADEYAIFTFDRSTHSIVSFDDWKRTPASEHVGLALRRMAEISPGWSSTYMGAALTTAAEAIGETDRKTVVQRAEIVLVSDFQTGSRIESVQGYEWPKQVVVSLEPVGSTHPTNAGLQVVAESREATTQKISAVRVRVTNSASAKKEQFQLQWVSGRNASASVGAAIDAYVPPGQSRVFSLPIPASIPPVRQMVLSGDDDAFDNAIYLVPPTQRVVNVQWLGADSMMDTRSPLFFLRRAYSDTPELAIHLTSGLEAATAATPANPPNLIFVGGDISAAQAGALNEHVRGGKTAVVVLRAGVSAAMLDAILGGSGTQVSEAAVSGYAMFADVDFRHPLFATFADPKFSDFTKIHIWHYRRVSLAGGAEARALAKFDNGDPAVIEIPLGAGRVFVFATGWQPDDSQIATSSKFVPLMWSLLDLADALPENSRNYLVGDAVTVPKGTQSVHLPSGATMSVDGGTARFSGTEQPGIYSFIADGTVRDFAVNLDPNESRTTPLTRDDLERLGIPVATKEQQAATGTAALAATSNADVENRQKLWRWAMVAALAVLLVETTVAGWTTRRASGLEKEITA